MPIGAISNGKNKNLELENWSLATQIGDKWHQIDSQGQSVEDWVFNGLVWTSEAKDQAFNFVGFDESKPIILSVEKTHDLLIDKLVIDYFVNGKNEPGKYWTFNLYRTDTNLGQTLISSTNTLNALYDSLSLPINLQDNLALNQTLFYQLEVEKNGNPGTLSISGKLIYKHWRN